MTRAELSASLPSWVKRESIEGAFDGDLEACVTLLSSAPNSERGHIVRSLYEARIEQPAFRGALAAAWEHDHAMVSRAAGTWRRFVSMFRYAAFPIPDDLPDMVTIWRGTAGFSFEDAAFGKAWTLDRNVACWFAMRSADHFGNPLVLRMAVPKRGLLFHSGARGEAEVIPARLRHVVVDGEPGEWRQAYECHEAGIRAVNRKPLLTRQESTQRV